MLSVTDLIERIQEEKGWTDATLLLVLKDMLEAWDRKLQVDFLREVEEFLLDR